MHRPCVAVSLAPEGGRWRHRCPVPRAGAISTVFHSLSGSRGISEGTLESVNSTNKCAVLPGELAEQVDFSCGDALSPPGTVGTQQSPPRHFLSHQDVHSVKKKGHVHYPECLFCVKKLGGVNPANVHFCYCLSFEIGSYISQACLELSMQPGMTLNF